MMKVVILAGGYGTRIRDVTEHIPKPMIPVGPYPILWHIMKIYSRYGYKDFIVCLGYKGETIREFFLNYGQYTRDLTVNLGDGEIMYHNQHNEVDWKITLVETGLHSMTGSRISKIRNYIKDEPFMFTYGDGLSDINIDRLVSFHHSHGKILTVTGVQPPGRFGEMLGEHDGLVSGFSEKPKSGSGGRVSGGFFVSNAEIFDYLEDDGSLVFEQQPMKNLVADKELMMYQHNGFWQPMDTSKEYQALNALYEKGNPPWMG